MKFDHISYEKASGVGEIRLNRPDRLNAISAQPGGTRDQLLAAVADAEDDPAVGCVLIAGAGSSFSGGGDVTGNPRRETPYEQQGFIETSEAFHRQLRAARLPIVAAVHGYCLGAAINLIASCDLVIAAKSARFGVPEGRIGLIGAAPLVPVVGRQWAKFLILSGELVDAEQARQIGLVLTVEPDDLLLERARDLAQRLARLPREAALLNKRAVDAIADAAGDAAGLVAGRAHDSVTLSNSARATAPDGRTFRQILDTEGMSGMKAARAAQYDEPWLRASPERDETRD
jgi:enoyl-CoA hydratase/carnithine racemase